MKRLSVFAICLFFCGCCGLEESEKERIRAMNAVAEPIYRTHDKQLFAIKPPKRRKRARYPWEEIYIGNHLRINKEFFRCKGSSDHEPLTRQSSSGPTHVLDCGGMCQHSLPLKDGREFIYPALIELLNYLQEKTQKKVVITCGHRCPRHNTYADSSSFNRTSKHMIGAEVDFYVQGLEWSPQTVISLIQAYYTEHPAFSQDPAFFTFKRFDQTTNVATPPWYNKEVFIKLFQANEGRDFDNDHGFPYISIQLKWDRDADCRISYSWASAFNNYLRY